MIDEKKFENLHFNRTVNLLQAFPESFPLHWHKYAEVAALPADADGQRLPEIRIQQKIYRLEPGDLLLIWPGELHEIVTNGTNGMFGVQFPPSIVNDLPEFVPFISRFRECRHIRKADTPVLAENMITHLVHIVSLAGQHGRFGGVESLISLLEMFMEFGEHLNREAVPETKRKSRYDSKISEKMAMACDYMIENCEGELSLERVADYVKFSPCYFSRVFKQTTNYSFVEYLTLQRVKKAQALLSDSDLPVTEISYLSGFKSISTFNRVFKQYEGCSPSDYRRYYNNAH